MQLIDRSTSPTLAALARDFAYGRKFVAWIGSGTSRSAGLPSWELLRRRLESRLAAAAHRVLPSMTPDERAALIAHIKRLPDHWEAFSALKARLPAYDYVQVIRTALDDSSVSVPESLCSIWKSANIEGVVSLNLDTLASRAYSSVKRGGREAMRATGDKLALAQKLLTEHRPYIVQLHGHVDEERTWVFTKEERDSLFENGSYHIYVSSLVTAKRLIFIGCSPDDIAIASHLKRIAQFSSSTLQHYWFVCESELTDSRRKELYGLGISPIEYSIPADCKDISAAHEAAIAELFQYLDTFQYEEPEPDPINPMAPPVGDKLPPERVQAMQPEQARNVLSRYATAILDNDDENFSNYSRFTKSYGAAIAVASYVERGSEGPLFGHSITKEIGSGAFSRVFQASSPDGSKKAIKLVRNEVRDEPVMLRSFRRGVQSMRIISDHGIDGMVWYDQAYEIPPCVMMPFIDGENLEEVVKHKDYSFRDIGLPVLRRVGEIVLSAHNLAERVLHRDLRPANIMLKPDDGESTISDRVVVLDFDLSWHEGADGDTAISPSMTTVLGYLAPEQIVHDLNTAARNSRVDTYGLCMTLLFMVQGKHIDYQQRTGRDWESFVSRIGLSTPGSRVEWRSWMPRIRRLINDGTHQLQSERLDFELVVNQLKMLQILSSGVNIKNVYIYKDDITFEAVGEEILAVITDAETYSWDSTQGRGGYTGVRGGSVRITEEVGLDGRCIYLTFEKMPDGTQRFETVKKYWHAQTKNIRDQLRAGGWRELDSKNAGYAGISLSFAADEAQVWGSLSVLSKSANQAWQKLNLL